MKTKTNEQLFNNIKKAFTTDEFKIDGVSVLGGTRTADDRFISVAIIGKGITPSVEGFKLNSVRIDYEDKTKVRLHYTNRSLIELLFE